MCFMNPFRYRGYYLDNETGFYYLNSRYYNPLWGRFLNADGYLNANGDLIGYNMFAYCSNNPIMNIDPNGEWSWKAFWQGEGATLAIALICATAVAVTVVVTGGAAAVAWGAFAATAASSALVGTLSTIDKSKDLEKGESIDKNDILNICKDSFFGAVEGVVSYTTGSIVTTTKMDRIAKAGAQITNHIILPILSASIEFGVDDKNYLYFQESVFKSNLPSLFRWGVATAFS